MSCPFNSGAGSHADPNPATPPNQVGGSPTSASSPGEGGFPSATKSMLGFQTTNAEFFKSQNLCHYSEYLGVSQLLNLQNGPAMSKPGGQGMMHHEEALFIVTHQVFELWFKLVMYDLREALKLLERMWDEGLPNADIHQRVSLGLHFLRRAERIFEHSSGAFSVMETMHPSDFLEFRDYLVPASGFQSCGFRQLEILLGVNEKGRARINGVHVFEPLQEAEKELLREALKQPSLSKVVNQLLSHVRVPESFLDRFLETVEKVLRQQHFEIAKANPEDKKAKALIKSTMMSTRQMIEDPVEWCEDISFETPEEMENFKYAVRGALFVVSYRHDPRYAVLAMLLDQLVAVEEGMLLWRGRHMHMAERMIGRRMGTGGSSGVGYLDRTRHYRIFHPLWLVRKLAVRSSALPPLSEYTDLPNTIFGNVASPVASAKAQ